MARAAAATETRATRVFRFLTDFSAISLLLSPVSTVFSSAISASSPCRLMDIRFSPPVPIASSLSSVLRKYISDISEAICAAFSQSDSEETEQYPRHPPSEVRFFSYSISPSVTIKYT